MKFNRLSIQLLLVLAFVGASQPMQGMSYLKAAYNAAVNYWHGKPKQQELLLSVQLVSAKDLDIPATILQDFENITKALGKEYIGTKLREDKQFADSVSKLIKSCVENFSIVMRSEKVWERLGLIVPHKDAKLFIKPCIENFQALIKFQRLDLLCLLMLHYDNKNFDQLIEPCIQNFQTLITTPVGLWLLSNFASYKETAQLLAEPCRENFEMLSKTSAGIMLLCELAQDGKSAELLTKHCLANIQTLIKSDNSLFLLGKLAGHKEAAELLAKPCIENFDYILNQQYGKSLIQGLAKNNQLVRDFIIQKIATRCGVEFTINQRSPTLLHLTTNALQDLEKFAEGTGLKNLLKTVITKEQQLSDDYYTFVHGQRRDLYLPEKIYTHLWQLKKKQSLQNFLFAHVKDLVESPDDVAYDKVQKNFILSHGNYDTLNSQVDARLKLLFMNYALFANTRNLGSNTAYYVLNNVNANDFIDLSPIDPFRMFGYQAVCDKKLRAKIEVVAQEYKDASKYGNLLFIAVPKNKVHKYVYLAHGGGPKRSLEIEGIGETPDIRIIMDTLLNAPHKIKDTDKLEFCLIMMQRKGGLDPNTGIKVMPILSGDPQKLEELKKKEGELLAEITQKVQDFERRENALACAAVLSKHMNDGSAVKIQSKL